MSVVGEPTLTRLLFSSRSIAFHSGPSSAPAGRDVAAGLADLLALLRVADQPVAAVWAVSPVELAVGLGVPHFLHHPRKSFRPSFPVSARSDAGAAEA